MNDNYFPNREIIAQFPPEDEKEKNPIFALAFVIGIVGAFGFYLMQQSSLKANMSRMDFWGMLMVLNVAVILGVFVAFWIKVLLIDTLWSLLFLSPFTLFIFNKGLAGKANCEPNTN